MAEAKKKNWFARAWGAICRYFRELRSELKKKIIRPYMMTKAALSELHRLSNHQLPEAALMPMKAQMVAGTVQMD